jgi:hypothetical protein
MGRWHDFQQSVEEDYSHWHLAKLKNAVNDDPPAQGPIAQASSLPIQAQECSARDAYDNAAATTEEHDDLEEPHGLIWISSDHIEQWILDLIRSSAAVEKCTNALRRFLAQNANDGHKHVR